MGKVLVADDAGMIRSRMVTRLRLLPGVGDVVEAVDCQSTLALIDAECPDFVVLDMFLPGGSGLEILLRLRATGSTARVIIHTAWPDEHLRQRSLAAGALGFFEKGAGSLDAIEAIGAMLCDDRLRSNCGPQQHAASSLPAPIALVATAGSAPVAEAATPAAGLTVLVVEDHDFQRKTLTRLMNRLGAARVLDASDGREAIALLAANVHAVQLIVCDLDMPNMDGMEFIRWVSKTGSSAALVITSAQDLAVLNSVETMCQAYGVRPLGVVEKPVTRDVLAGLLERLKNSVSVPPPALVAKVFDLQTILDSIEAGQFEPFFQPKVDLASGRIVGAEALARWRHPVDGLLAPAFFIDLLETSGQIDGLTFLMIERAAQACVFWHSIGMRIGVSVNLSLSSLGDTELAGRLTAAIRHAGLDPRHMTLEITETAAMTQVAPALENLARLRMHGFGLSIDDFGTGFASLEQLGRIAFTELKIDRRFVSTMTSRREAGAIVASSVDIGRRLGINTIAEGVETANQWDALKIAGCTQGQGYLIARPLEQEQFIGYCMGRN